MNTQVNGAADHEEGHEVDPSMAAESGMVALISNAEINQQIATARKFPRSIKRFRDEALAMVTLTQEIAQECIYALPRDGKVIEGPSARFAEVVASAWGNCRAGSRVVNEGPEFVTSQGVFHDLERNVSITYEVQRRITGKYGRFKPDMIGVTANAACSIALRNAILKGVPKAFWSDMYKAARKTVMGDFETLSNRRAHALAEFQAFGVTLEMICATLQIAGKEDIGLEQLVILRGILTAIQDGDTTVEQAFGNDKPQVQQPRSKSATNTPEGVQPEPTPAGKADESTAQKTQAGAGDKPASTGQIKLIRGKLAQQDQIDESALCIEFGVKKLEGISIGTGNKMLAKLTDAGAG